MYRDHSVCRACGNEALVPVFDLGNQPLANDFCEPESSRKGFAPLKVLFCPQCTLSQLSVVVDPSVLYENYPYVTSNSATMLKHFVSIVADIKSEGGRGPLVEIGSNDGLFLATLRDMGFDPVIGIDPAENLSEIAAKRDVKTIVSLFDRDSAKDAKKILGHVNTVVARHVFAHTDNWKEFVAGIEEMSNPETLVCIEVPYCGDMLAKREWDTIYHEHLSYVTVRSVEALLEGTNFHLHRIIRYPIHGGAMLLMLRHNDHESIPHVSVHDELEAENIDGQTWKDFAGASQWQAMQLSEYVRKLTAEGHTVVGFGASAKSTVAINGAKLGDELKFITDTTPQKQGRLSPGTNIPIVPQEMLLQVQPHYAICFAWNYRDEILKRNAEFRQRGGKFIFFVPKLEVV